MALERPADSAALSVEPWHGRRVYDFETGSYLGRAEGEPYSDGIEGVIRLRQDEDGQTIKPYALCAFVKLLCPGDFGCNTLMPKKLTAELAKRSARLLAQPGSEVLAPFLPRDLSPSRVALVAAYLARVEDYYRSGAGALSGAYVASEEA